MKIIRHARIEAVRVAQNDAALRDSAKFSCGVPCSRGHESLRYTRTAQCVKCKSEISEASRVNNRVAMNARTREIYADKREHIRSRDNALRNANSDRFNEWQRKYRKFNKERLNGRQRERYALNPCPHRERSHLYAASHAEQRRIAQRERIRRNPERVRARHQREYYADIASSRAASRSRFHTRRSMTREGISGAIFHKWCENMPKNCFYCGSDCAKSYHADHFIPLSKGGQHVLQNLRMSCPRCNLRKKDKIVHGVEVPL